MQGTVHHFDRTKPRSIFAILLVLGGSLLAMLVVPARPALAHDCGGHLQVIHSRYLELPKKRQFWLRQVSNGRYLDAHEIGRGKDYRVVTRTAQNNDTQRWDLEAVGEIFTIHQWETQRDLDAYEYGADNSVVTRTKQINDTQRWAVMPAGDGSFTIRQVSNGRFLDAHQYGGRDFSVVTRTAQNNDTQRWYLNRISGFSSDVMTIRQKSSGRYLDAWVTSDHDYDVVTRPAQNNDTQRWIFNRVGYIYKVRQHSNGRYVDAHVTSDRDYTVVTRTAQDNDTQNWSVIHGGCGTEGYTIRQLGNNRFVDAHEYSGRDYDVVTRAAQDNTTQRWELIDTTTGRGLLIS